MRARIFGAAAAAALLVLIAGPALADILDLTDGQKGFRLPKSRDIKSPWGEFPTDTELRASGRRNSHRSCSRDAKHVFQFFNQLRHFKQRHRL